MDELTPIYDCEVVLYDGTSFDVQVDGTGLRLFLSNDKVSHVVVKLFKLLP